MEDTILQQKGRKKLSSHSVLHFYRNRVMNILLILIGILYVVCRTAYIIPKQMQRCYNQLFQNIQTAERYQEYINSSDELYITVQDQEYLSACNIFIGYINSGYDAQAVIDRLTEISDDYNSIFYLKGDGTLISSADRAPLSLTDEQMTQLLMEGSLIQEDDPVRYWALSNGDDTMIVVTDETFGNHITMDVLPVLYLDGFTFDNNTLEVMKSNESIIPSNVSTMYIGETIEDIDQFAGSQMQIRMISPYNSGLAKYTNMKLAAIQTLNSPNSSYSICAYIPLSEIISNILVESILPTFLYFGFIGLCIYGSLHFRQTLLKGKNEEANATQEKGRKTISLPFQCFIRADLTRCILLMQLLMAFLIIACTAVLLSLSSFSTSYDDAEYNLHQLSETEKSCQATLSTCWDAYTEPAVGLARTINRYYLSTGDVTTDENVQAELDRMVESTYLEEISVYDENGNNVYTTSNSIGYPLSTDPSSPLYSFWNLLSGDREYLLVRSDSNEGIIYCAMKRSDAIGIVVVSFSDQGFSELEQKLSSESIISGCDYNDSCLFVDLSEDSMDSKTANIAYRIGDDGTEISCIAPNLPLLSENETFCGFRKYNNQQCLMVGLGEESKVSFYFEPVSEITSGLGNSLWTYSIFLLVICLLIYLGTGVFTAETVNSKLNTANAESDGDMVHHLTDLIIYRTAISIEMENAQKAILQRGLYGTIILLAITILLDTILSGSPMLTFLLSGCWEKGLNLFALAEVSLIFLFSCLIFLFLRLLFNELSKNFSGHYITVVQMVHSILNICLAVFLIVFCASELGINTTSIIASVGISGLALGIAAKDTINDMLNGLFIIMDKRIQVGDWVEVDGFYGQVVRIGIRTTKLKKGNSERSINNSDMNGLTNFSKGQSNLTLEFKVVYDTDLDYLKELLQNSFEKFQEACNGGLRGGVRFVGATGFSADAINVKICIPCEEKDREDFVNKCFPVLIKLLTDNGIQVSSDDG